MHLCSIFDRTQIFGSHDVKTRKQDPLHSRKRAYLRIQSNSRVYFLQEKITLKIFLFQTHLINRSCFHHIIHSIKSNSRFSTRLFFFNSFQNLTHVSAQDYLFSILFKVITHVSALGYPFSIFFQNLTHVSTLGYLFSFLFKVLSHVSALSYPFSILFKVITHVSALDYLVFNFLHVTSPHLNTR